MKRAYFRCSVLKLSAIMGFHRWPRMRKRRKRWQKKKSLGVGMSCVVDLCNWQRVSMDSTRASRCLSGLQRVSGLLIGVWTIYTSYLYICMSLCPRMTAPAEREKLRRSAWLGAECPHVGWSDCCLSSYIRHPSGPGVCCVKHTPGAQFGVI